MALQTFKDVIQNKGYRINSNDRAIFEEGNLQSFFGLSDSDLIEFVVYDARDNQLPQGNYGKVRYIKLSTENIKDYILIPMGTEFQKYKFPKEYFVDVEQLLKEAGYTNGIFKTQITLVNSRAGRGDENTSKLWISEISPSRTEIRLYPLKKGLEEHNDLQERFNIFVNNKNFREDTIYNISNFLQKIKADYVSELIKNKYTAKWFDTLKAEFKIANFDEFATKIRNAFVQSSEYEFSNRFSTIGQPNYGQVKSTKQNLDLSVLDIKNTCKRILTEVINHYLLYPDVKTKTTFDYGFNASNDYVTSVLQRNTSDTIIDTSFPVLKQTTILKGPINPLDTAVTKEDPSKPTTGPVVVIEQPNPPKPPQTGTNNPYDGQIDKPSDAPQRPRQPVGGPSRGNPNETDAFGNPTGAVGNPTGTGNTVPPSGGATSNPNEQDPAGGTTGGGTTRGGATGGETTPAGGGTTGATTNPFAAGIYIPPIQIAVGPQIPIIPNPPYDDKPVITTPPDSTPYIDNPFVPTGGDSNRDLGASPEGGGLGYDGYFGS
jgi:hypothetical protein